MAIIVFVTTVILMMSGLIFFPKIRLFKKEFESYWLIVLIGAIVAIFTTGMDSKNLIDSIFKDSEMNPIKLVTFFISMTILSIYLNEIGFFQKVAYWVLKKVNNHQNKIFLYFSLLVSILTIFVSNDVIILTFIPIMIYFARHAKINPLPYLFAVLVFANTFSLILIVGNPTNVYLATNQNISFLEYMKVMFIPGIITGIVSYLILWFIFRKELKKQIEVPMDQVIEIDQTKMVLGLVHLGITLVLLTLSNLISLEMWIITIVADISLLGITYFINRKHKNSQHLIKSTLKKAPWTFIPLIIGMYILVDSVKQNGFHVEVFNLLNQFDPIYGYGISTFFLANIMNNLPMTMFMQLVIEEVPAYLTLKVTYASIIGANLGVLLSPFGALAGLMWYDLLKQHEIKISIGKYIKTLLILGIVSLLMGLFVLSLII
ncbi:hypothetical protein JV173_02255 [Acholeplasma equirhinis]|uniref:SLC13 family permease n=1 Tax=Acholeplasma equirhinis TaxID=555393 RepID=UPI00197A7212|nr:SLC13 family permease [Acholeplasma equirhinis]MBN3490329.1 hypothetical protein [Acholeplasma equirhinis]